MKESILRTINLTKNFKDNQAMGGRVSASMVDGMLDMGVTLPLKIGGYKSERME